MKINENFIHNKYGYCFYSIENDSALIYNLYIEPCYRQKGHAKNLLQLVIREIRKSGHGDEIRIESCPREDGISLDALVALYSKLGLKVI